MADPIVQLDDGKLRGKLTKDSNGETVFAFVGVPYGKPPIGDLRFKAPQPVEPWDGIKNAVEDTTPSAHIEFVVSREYFGGEDCLYMNVFTKTLSDAQPLQPVLVFFHGGGYTMGSNKTKSYSPNFLMTEDIVFVAINYRLGILGFLSLDDTSLEVPGNAGLKDQNLALRWIQKNIHKFGGDPKNVTISGESAGSASVNYHMLSPTSRGLFHKGILQSGSVFNPWPHLNPKWKDMMKYLRKDFKNDSDILEILMNTPTEELIQAQLKWMDELNDSMYRYFAPCVEKPNPTAFLTRKPADIILSGDYYKVPIIIGYNSNEGLYAYLDQHEYDKFKNGLVMPAQIVLPNDAAKREELVDKIQKVYRGEKYKNNLFQASGDSMFVAGIIGLAEHLIQTSPEPIYFYEFDLVASRNKFRKMLKVTDEYPGASHVDELGYLYEGALFEDTPLVPDSIEDITIRRFVKFWGNFMKYGNPTPKHEELKFTWKPMTKDRFNYLHITEELKIKTNPAEDRMLLWREIYKSHEDTKDYMP